MIWKYICLCHGSIYSPHPGRLLPFQFGADPLANSLSIPGVYVVRRKPSINPSPGVWHRTAILEVTVAPEVDATPLPSSPAPVFDASSAPRTTTPASSTPGPTGEESTLDCLTMTKEGFSADRRGDCHRVALGANETRFFPMLLWGVVFHDIYARWALVCHSPACHVAFLSTFNTMGGFRFFTCRISWYDCPTCFTAVPPTLLLFR